MTPSRNIVPQKVELLAPARDVITGIEAIKHGADAVYIGPPDHGARAAASNSLADIGRLCDFAHQFDARIYATVNTLVYDSELRDVEAMVGELYRVGVDALIVQDMALLRLDLPPIDLHASTQCDIRTIERARWLARCGFSQLVVPRELTLDETAAMRREVPADVVLEAFVHGALCVSYSGDCQASCVTTPSGRSANRGDCAQICRLSYDLADDKGRVLMGNRHFLSLRDLNRSRLLREMLEAGVGSFKIEGRLKDVGYVKNVTAYYRREFDRIIDDSEGRYKRASQGRSEIGFVPDLSKSFNRGFTEYFTVKPESADIKMGSLETPKWRGEPVGRVERVNGRVITASLRTPLTNGDGLVAVAADGRLIGFRLNRIEGNRLFAASDIAGISRGTMLFRNHDRQREELMQGATADRRITVDVTLRSDTAGRIVVDIFDEDGRGVVTVADYQGDCQPQAARTDQTEAHRRVMTKTGDTIYDVRKFDDRIPELFIPLSRLASLRREAFSRLSAARRIVRPVRLRRGPLTAVPPLEESRSLTYHNNVANHIARDIYAEAGADSIQPALETMRPAERIAAARTIMTTRYCLRRELGQCHRHDSRRTFPDGPLYLRALPGGSFTLRLDFDCAQCRMRVSSFRNK